MSTSGLSSCLLCGSELCSSIYSDLPYRYCWELSACLFCFLCFVIASLYFILYYCIVFCVFLTLLYRPVIAAAVEDHRLVLSLGIAAVWLSFLACSVPAVSWTPDSCHLAWMIDTVACVLSSTSCASTLWVDRHSVPWACLPHPWVTHLWLDGRSCLWPVFLLPRLPLSFLTKDFV